MLSHPVFLVLKHIQTWKDPDTNLDDLATTQDASDVCDITDVGRLTSPLFSREREVSAIPSGVSGSQTHSNMERPMRDTDLFPSIGRPVRDVESFSSFDIPLSQVQNERILYEQKSHHEFLEKKADHSFQGEIAAQTKVV